MLRALMNRPCLAACALAVLLVGHTARADEGAEGDVPRDVCRRWDFATYGNTLVARFFATEGRDVYYLSHPRTHGCLADGSCDFLR